ncbi:DUF1349 domain-containing protein [Paracoccus sp. SM22M-07]|uniref:DUF1349 domain-containing protein n=1 Tax=Paracoccus sp. SM22M-07 TaxID=1520813 RepID=UPI0021103DCC|nr:DUF1349 domain-containing protein [Paracoccus sp. SM22M-07]
MNPPENVARDGDVLRVTTGANTDFWRGTFYGFYRDNGHFLHQHVEGDFTVEVSVSGDYRVFYDQAGLMVRLSESYWIKAGIEHTDGKNYFSLVVTNNMSDWSLVEVPSGATDVRIRLTRHAEAIRVQYYNPLEETFVPVRLAYFPPTAAVDAGMMCCSPQRSGFEATFKGFRVGEVTSRDLHA